MPKLDLVPGKPESRIKPPFGSSLPWTLISRRGTEGVDFWFDVGRLDGDAPCAAAS